MCESIINTIREKASLLDKWRRIHEDKFGVGSHTIPDSGQVSIAKLGIGGGGVMTDNCNSANLLGRQFAEKAEQLARESVRTNGGDESVVLVMQ